RDRALDEAAAQDTRLALARLIKNAGLSRRNAVLAIDQLNLAPACAVPQPGSLWRARRTDFHEDLPAIVGQCFLERSFADPVDVAQHDSAHAKRFARADDDAPPFGIKTHNIQRRAGSDPKAAPLADGEMNDPGMRAQHFSIKIDNIAGLRRARLQPLDNIGVMTGRDEADVLAVMLVGNGETESPRKLSCLGLAPFPERKA